MTKSRNLNAPRHNWTDQQLATLREHYPHQRTADLAAQIGVDLQLVYKKATTLGLRKSAAFTASDKSGRIFRGGKLGQYTQFAPGQKPWNAGTHYVAGGRSAETRFKKGQMSGAAQHNYVPIGSLRISKDGILERKMTDDPAMYPARRWTPVARLVWEAAHGPIPQGSLIVFRPGCKTATFELITINELECITRAQNALRNHPRNKSPELGRLYQLKGAITRQVNRINRESQPS